VEGTPAQCPGRLDVIPRVESHELHNQRDILVYLPSSYDKSEKPYPVLYMHDGQNLFDPTTSFAGEWGVDSALARAPRKGRRAIVVGIPNAGIHRSRSIRRSFDGRIGGGLGDAYLDWLEGTIKPMIDERYRTIRGPEGTGIGGSSLGGLISLYGFFSRARSVWFRGGPESRRSGSAMGDLPLRRSGRLRGRAHLPGRWHARRRRHAGQRAHDARPPRREGYRRGKDLMWVEDRGGVHNEAAWGRRLRSALAFPPWRNLNRQRTAGLPISRRAAPICCALQCPPRPSRNRDRRSLSSRALPCWPPS
jgi:hypothetical protein